MGVAERRSAAMVGRAAALAIVGALAGCGATPASTATVAAVAPSPPPPRPAALVVAAGPAQNNLTGDIIPPGYGSLHQDDISITLQPTGVRVTAIPLDETIIRVLSPDSYRALRAIADSRRAQIAQRTALRGGTVRDPRVWYVTYTGLVADARFVPTDITVTSGGRDFRPFDVIGLTPGFAEQILQPRVIQRGLLLFDDLLDMSQPVIVAIGTERNADWEGILQKIDAERASVRSRAAGKP